MPTAVPVKYMPVKGGEHGYEILDTSYEGQGKVVCSTESLEFAHHLARILNRTEGFEYPD